MKTKCFLIGFILLTFGGFCLRTNTRAADYSLGFSERDEFIFEIKIADLEGLEELFTSVDPEDGGQGWRYNMECTAELLSIFSMIDTNDDEIGAKMKFNVDWINESDDFIIIDREEEPDERVEIEIWRVFLNIWQWIDPDNDFNPEPDYEEVSFIEDEDIWFVIFQDPDDFNMYTYNDDPQIEASGATFESIFFFCPTPVANYLDEVDFKDKDWIPDEFNFELGVSDPADEDDITFEYDIDGNKLILENTFVWDDDDDQPMTVGNDWDYREFREEWTWDENTGILSLYQLFNEENEILYEVAAVSSIPGYELPILLGITATFTAGLIYIVRKETR